jgi:hypothetical protein
MPLSRPRFAPFQCLGHVVSHPGAQRRRHRRPQHVPARDCVSQSTVHHWVHHAQGQRLDPVDWHDLPHTPRTPARTDSVEVLGRSFEVDPYWLNRLVRVEVDLDGDKIRIYRLRRRAPRDQPLLRELQHHIKIGRFRE